MLPLVYKYVRYYSLADKTPIICLCIVSADINISAVRYTGIKAVLSVYTDICFFYLITKPTNV